MDETRCCDSAGRWGWNCLLLITPFPFPTPHPPPPFHTRPSTSPHTGQPLGIPGTAVTWGSVKALSCLAGGPGTIPDLRESGGSGARWGGRCSLPLAECCGHSCTLPGSIDKVTLPGDSGTSEVAVFQVSKRPCACG